MKPSIARAINILYFLMLNIQQISHNFTALQQAVHWREQPGRMRSEHKAYEK